MIFSFYLDIPEPRLYWGGTDVTRRIEELCPIIGHRLKRRKLDGKIWYTCKTCQNWISGHKPTIDETLMVMMMESVEAMMDNISRPSPMFAFLEGYNGIRKA